MERDKYLHMSVLHIIRLKYKIADDIPCNINREGSGDCLKFNVKAHETKSI